MTARLSPTVQAQVATVTPTALPGVDTTWRYHVVSVLLFAIEVQYKLLMLPVLAVVACLRFALAPFEKQSEALMTPAQGSFASSGAHAGD